jgi:hypothetical protein
MASETVKRSWKERFIELASKTGDVSAACKAVEIPLYQYFRQRQVDPQFDAACDIVDLAVQAAISTALTSKAAAGDIKAIKLLWRGLQNLELPYTEKLGPPPAVSEHAARLWHALESNTLPPYILRCLEAALELAQLEVRTRPELTADDAPSGLNLCDLADALRAQPQLAAQVAELHELALAAWRRPAPAGQGARPRPDAPPVA